MKIPLPDQIAEAELHRDEMAVLAKLDPKYLPRLHRCEGLCMTLRLIEATETEFRQFMRSRPSA